jgi:hypothetical protein
MIIDWDFARVNMNSRTLEYQRLSRHISSLVHNIFAVGQTGERSG